MLQAAPGRPVMQAEGAPSPPPAKCPRPDAAVKRAALSALTFRNFSTRSCLAGSGPMRTFSYLQCANERAASGTYMFVPFNAQRAGGAFLSAAPQNFAPDTYAPPMQHPFA